MVVASVILALAASGMLFIFEGLSGPFEPPPEGKLKPQPQLPQTEGEESALIDLLRQWGVEGQPSDSTMPSQPEGSGTLPQGIEGQPPAIEGTAGEGTWSPELQSEWQESGEAAKPLALEVGESSPGQLEMAPNRDGFGADVVCYTVFDPYLGCDKRLHSVDCLRSDYTAYVCDQELRPVSLNSTNLPNVFEGELSLDLRAGTPIAIPSVAPDASISAYETYPHVPLQFFKDGADNYYVMSLSARSDVTLRFTTSADPGYFTLDIPAGLTLNDIPSGMLHMPPPSIVAKAEALADGLGLTNETGLRQIVYSLKEYFSGFTSGDIPTEDEQPDPYLAAIESEHGACFVRAFAFFVTANSLGVPTRLITNEGHSFVEVYVPTSGWQKADLGGLGSYELRNSSSSERFDAPEQETPGQGGGSGLEFGEQDEGGQPSGDAPGDSASGDLSRTPTVTRILMFDGIAQKGHTFLIEGDVSTRDGRPVTGMPVEVMLSKTKGQSGTPVGKATTSDGRFSAECRTPEEMPTGSYQLIAHSEGNERFDESWSDPEITVVSGTRIVLDAPDEARPGQTITIQGTLMEEFGAPMPGQSLTISVTGEDSVHSTTADEKGSFSFERTFAEEGTYGIRCDFAGSEFLLQSAANAQIQVVTPATGFPWWTLGFIPIGGAAAILAYILHRRRLTGEQAEEAPPEEAGTDPEPLLPAIPVMETGTGTRIQIEFPQIDAVFPDVWGGGDEFAIGVQLSARTGEPLPGQTLQVFVGEVVLSELSTDELGTAEMAHVFTREDECALSCRFDGDGDLNASLSTRTVRIVDYRKEIVVLFDSLSDWAQSLGAVLPKNATPREIGAAILAERPRLDENAIDAAISVFEEADYSTHTITRQHYERMWLALRHMWGFDGESG